MINQRIFETSLDLILVVDRRGTFVLVSPSSIAILGYRPDEMVGRSATEFLYPEDLENTRNEMREARHGRLTRNFECRYVRKDGGIAILNWTGVWSEPEQQHFFIGRDITEIKEAERRLQQVQEMNALLREGIDSMPAGFAIYDDEARLVLCNKSYRQLFPESASIIVPGVRFEEVLRDGLARGVYPDALGREEEWIAERVREHRSPNGSIEQRLGDGRWVLVGKHQMANGWTAGLRLDVTRLKLAEEALARANRQLTAVLEVSPVAIFMLDPGGKVALWTASAERIFGYSEQEALGRLPPYLTDEHMANFRANLALAAADSSATGFLETQRRRKDGAIIDVSVRWARVNDDGRMLGIMYAVADITERKKLEMQLRQAQKMEAIGTLTGGLAHDFNNHLGVVILNLDILLEQLTGDAEAEELAREAMAAALRGAELIRRLLAFARRQPLQPQRTAINRLVAEITKLLERTLGEEIRITLHLDDAVWPTVIDPAQLESALANLATNARDAMPNGGELVIVTGNRHLDEDYAAQHAEVRPGDYAMIEVSDSGSGMTQEVLTQVFEPFFTTKPLGKGTGLGLSMVFGFIKQSGGHINIYSEVGVGTTVRLYLPRADAAAEARRAPEPQAFARGHGETVLAVEDNPGLRRVVVRQLSELGYRVVEAEDALTALEILERERVAVLFTDVVLPAGVSGYELARSAIERSPDIKIVLTSGFPENRIAENGRLQNIKLLSKPYRREDIARVIGEALSAGGR